MDQNQSNQPTPSKRPTPQGPKFNWKLVLSLVVAMLVSLLLIFGIKTDWYGLANMNFANESASTTSSQATSTSSSASSESVASSSVSNEDTEATPELSANQNDLLATPETIPDKFVYDSGYDIAYPAEGVKGIYLSADGATNPTLYEQNMALLDNTNLNTVVLDVKDDYGNITMDLPTEDASVNAAETDAIDGKTLMQTFEDKQIYPIARITTFKDTNLAKAEPERSFQTADGQVWTNHGGDAFLNPYNKDNWAYLVETAKAAARAGFKDIQFDYVRFPEAFEMFGESLTYDMGDYAEYGKDSTEARQMVIADFLAYAREELKPYGVEVSADMFGYVTDVVATPGIGQNFNMMAENVDAISAMIYPSHWGPGYFGLDYPDLHPYEVVDAYMKKENALMQELDSPAKSRPWLQDFTASYLADGTWKEYGPAEVQEQIDAVIDNGATEYLLWDAANEYSPDVDYK
ncbi:putative glycoside hydrolase [Aerococcus agrisoli]|uniref:putative glycoside hydrolase n=1 Tax=Aerococcus agrisoli TaxID=2487350 RepID=UPI001F219100|nr:putative glycoside hydrolase [Aerococcus agrisoli]